MCSLDDNSALAAGSVYDFVLPVPVTPTVRAFVPGNTGIDVSFPQDVIAGIPYTHLSHLVDSFLLQKGTSYNIFSLLF